MSQKIKKDKYLPVFVKNGFVDWTEHTHAHTHTNKYISTIWIEFISCIEKKPRQLTHLKLFTLYWISDDENSIEYQQYYGQTVSISR